MFALGRDSDDFDAVVFYYGESEDIVWATYRGASVRRGFLIGTRAGSKVTSRYVEVDVDGSAATGMCVGEIRRMSDGRLAFLETWLSGTGERGSRVVEEVRSWSGFARRSEQPPETPSVRGCLQASERRRRPWPQ